MKCTSQQHNIFHKTHIQPQNLTEYIKIQTKCQKNILKHLTNSLGLTLGHPNSCVRIYRETDLRAWPEVSEPAASKTPTFPSVYPTCRTITTMSYMVHDVGRVRKCYRGIYKHPIFLVISRETGKISSYPTISPKSRFGNSIQILMTYLPIF